MSKTFLLGQLLATPAALQECKAAGVSPPFRYFARHAQQDWGDLCTQYKRANDRALRDGSRILSAYHLPSGTKIWIITEAEDDDGKRVASYFASAGGILAPFLIMPSLSPNVRGKMAVQFQTRGKGKTSLAVLIQPQLPFLGVGGERILMAMTHTRRALMMATVLASLSMLITCGGGGINVPNVPVVHAGPGANNSTLQGAYAFSFSGFEGNNYTVAVGTITFDGNGKITGGSETLTEQGGFQATFALSGTYAVNSDGTGTISMQFFGASIDTWSIAVLSTGQKLRMVSIEPNNFLNGALVGEMEKQ